MRSWLGRLLGGLARWIVGFFPLVVLVFLVLVDPWAGRLLLWVGGGVAIVAVLVAWLAHSDPSLRQALTLALTWLLLIVACAGLFAGVASLAWDWTRRERPTADATTVPEPAPTLPPKALQHVAHPEWQALPSPWPEVHTAGAQGQPLPGGLYRLSLTEPLIGTVVVAPWRDLPPDVLLRAQAHWQGLNRDGAWGVVCRYQGPGRFYAFTLSGDGFVAIWKQSGEEIRPLTGWKRLPLAVGGMLRSAGMTPTPARPRIPSAGTLAPGVPAPQSTPTPTPGLPVVRGAGRLLAVCQGSQLALYVADRLVAQAEDNAYTVGRVGLWAASPHVAPWTVWWERLDLYVLPRP